MYSILLKRKIITILPMDSSFHFSLEMSEDVKMSSELLKLNYSHYSPYPSAEIISYYDGHRLHLWFYKEKISSLIIIPEAYLLFSVLKETYTDSAIVIKDKVLLIKNSKLLNSFLLQNNDTQILNLSMDQYGIANTKNLDENLDEKILKQLNLADIFMWKNPSLSMNGILSSAINFLAIPISILLMIILFMNMIHDNILSSKIENLEEEYTKLKLKNDDIRSELKAKNKTRKMWKSFMETELVYPDIMLVLESLMSKIPKEKVSIRNINIINGVVSVGIESDKNPVYMLNEFIDVKYVKNVSIKRNFKVKNKVRSLVYEMDLIPLGNKNEF